MIGCRWISTLLIRLSQNAADASRPGSQALPPAYINVPYRARIWVKDHGDGPWSFQCTGALPGNLRCDEGTGVIFGTPTLADSSAKLPQKFEIKINVTNNYHQVASLSPDPVVMLSPLPGPNRYCIIPNLRRQQIRGQVTHLEILGELSKMRVRIPIIIMAIAPSKVRRYQQ